MKPHLKPHITDRGFKHMPPIPSIYGGNIKVYEASSAEEPRLWAKIECPVDMNKPNGEMQDAVALLSLENAEQLMEQIQFLKANHYQLDE